jgi:hypothetical protein
MPMSLKGNTRIRLRKIVARIELNMARTKPRLMGSYSLAGKAVNR